MIWQHCAFLNMWQALKTAVLLLVFAGIYSRIYHNEVDLRSVLNWPMGAVIAQCCHATAAVMHLNSEDTDTISYLKDLDNMHKVVLEAKDEAALVKLSEKLKENQIKHKLWIEQPENIPTCIALKPYVKDTVHKYVKNFKLLKE